MAVPARLTLGLALALAACGGPPQDPVERLLHDVEGAAEDRDAAAVAERLAEDFEGEGRLRKADAVAMLRRYLAGYERVGIEIYEVQRQEDGRLTLRADFSGKPRDVGGLAGLLAESVLYEFELELAGEGDELKIRRATWRLWAPPVRADP
jgi:hypothetical protein